MQRVDPNQLISRFPHACQELNGPTVVSFATPMIPINGLVSKLIRLPDESSMYAPISLSFTNVCEKIETFLKSFLMLDQALT